MTRLMILALVLLPTLAAAQRTPALRDVKAVQVAMTIILAVAQ